MGTFQNTFGTVPAIGVAGMRANSEIENIISRTLESAAGVAFGQPVFQGAADHGCIIGAAFGATAVGAAVAGNTGAGAITASPAVVSPAVQGVYTIIQVTGGATGAFTVYDPDGVIVGDGAVGTEFVGGGLTFTITDPGTDPAIGDRYTVTVTYTANARCLGIAVVDPIVPALASAPDAYPQYSTVSILTQGVVYVTAGLGGVTKGGQAYWNPATGKYTAATGVKLSGCYYDTTAAADALVKLAVRERLAP